MLSNIVWNVFSWYCWSFKIFPSVVEFRNVKFMQTLGCRKLSSSSFSPISPELKMPNYPILIWLDKFYVFLTGYNKIRRKRPGSKFKWCPHVASQPLAEVSTGGTLDRGGRPSMAHSTGNRTQGSEIPALCADTTQRASSHWADTVFCAASISSEVGATRAKSGDKRGKKHTRGHSTAAMVIEEGLCRPCHETQLAGSSDICLMVVPPAAAVKLGSGHLNTSHYTVYRHQPLPDTISQPLSWK